MRLYVNWIDLLHWLSKYVQIDRPGSYLNVEVNANLFVTKSIGS
jgi:hypothetical protein